MLPYWGVQCGERPCLGWSLIVPFYAKPGRRGHLKLCGPVLAGQDLHLDRVNVVLLTIQKVLHVYFVLG
jgi:hypothetical protein